MNDFDLLLPKQKAWVVECLSSFPEYQHYAAADCAEELPDELLYLQNMAEEDEDVELQRKVSHYLQPILSHRFLNNLA
jgi:hypothetical protein